jgi:hypothetical protein
MQHTDRELIFLSTTNAKKKQWLTDSEISFFSVGDRPTEKLVFHARVTDRKIVRTDEKYVVRPQKMPHLFTIFIQQLIHNNSTFTSIIYLIHSRQ